jgi:hypothetical protein
VSQLIEELQDPQTLLTAANVSSCVAVALFAYVSLFCSGHHWNHWTATLPLFCSVHDWNHWMATLPLLCSIHDWRHWMETLPLFYSGHHRNHWMATSPDDSVSMKMA